MSKTFYNGWTGKHVTLDDSNLTEKEAAIMIQTRDNNFSDFMTSDGDWTFALNEDEAVPNASFGGVLTSLIKKGYIVIWNEKTPDSTTALTEAGKKLFSDYTGESK